jgi:hypothetical protein
VSVALTLCTPELAGELLWPATGEPAAGEVAAEPGEPIAAAMPAPLVGTGGQGALAPAPATLSYSAIADYERCGYRYHLQRAIALPDVEATGGAGERAAARGVAVHALLERLDFAAPLAPSAAEVSAGAALAGVELDPREDLGAVADLVAAFARSPLCERLALAREVRREEAFAFVFAGGELLRGFLDVVAFEHHGGLLIVDYKTDRVDGGAADLEARVERDYSLQRLVYALAGIASGAAVVEVAHCFLRHPEVVLATRYRAGERQRLEATLAERLEPLRAGRFEVSDDPNVERCGSCPGRARLCSHDQSLTLREPRSGPPAPGI